jgi:hypothetical protein
MSYEIHIVRGPECGNPEHQITAAEWIAYIESDPELQRVTGQNPNFIQAKLVSTPNMEDDGQVLTALVGGGAISSGYAEKPLLSKISQIAKHFGAYVVSDDGDLWNITEDGTVQVESPGDVTETKVQPAKEERPLPRGIMWPFFNYDPETDPRRMILWLLSCQSDNDIVLAERCLADGLQIPLREAADALRTCQSGQPVGMPLPEDLEEACLLCERLQKYGIVNKGCGVRVPPW